MKTINIVWEKYKIIWQAPNLENWENHIILTNNQHSECFIYNWNFLSKLEINLNLTKSFQDKDINYFEVFWIVYIWDEIYSKEEFLLFRDIKKSINENEDKFFLQYTQNFLQDKKPISNLYIWEYEKIIIKNIQTKISNI